MKEIRNVYNILAGNLRRKDHLEYLGVDERIILKQEVL
jgi:hypothetical protein